MKPYLKKEKFKWTMPLPKVLQNLNIKFQGLEKITFCFWSRGRSRIAFKEICFCIHMFCRKKITIFDVQQINNFIPNTYFVGTVLAMNKISKRRKKTLKLFVVENLTLKKEKTLNFFLLKLRTEKFLKLLENEVLRQHQDYITWNNSWITFTFVRTKREFHPKFTLNYDFKMEKIFLKSKVCRKTNLFNEKIQKKLYKKKNNSLKNVDRLKFCPIRKKFSDSSFSFLEKRNYFSSFSTGNLILSFNLRRNISKNINPILRHLSPSIFIKNQERRKSKQFLDNLSTSLKKQRLKDLIYIVDIIQSIFILNKKSSICYNSLLVNISETNKRNLALREVVKYLDYLCVSLPQFYQIKKNNKDENISFQG